MANYRHFISNKAHQDIIIRIKIHTFISHIKYNIPDVEYCLSILILDIKQIYEVSAVVAPSLHKIKMKFTNIRKLSQHFLIPHIRSLEVATTFVTSEKQNRLRNPQLLRDL